MRPQDIPKLLLPSLITADTSDPLPLSRSQPEDMSALYDSKSSRTSSPPPAKRHCFGHHISPKYNSETSQSRPAASSIQRNPVPSDPVPSTTKEPRTPRSTRQHPPHVKESPKRIIKIINATFAVCKGTFASSRALGLILYTRSMSTDS